MNFFRLELQLIYQHCGKRRLYPSRVLALKDFLPPPPFPPRPVYCQLHKPARPPTDSGGRGRSRTVGGNAWSSLFTAEHCPLMPTFPLPSYTLAPSRLGVAHL